MAEQMPQGKDNNAEKAKQMIEAKVQQLQQLLGGIQEAGEDKEKKKKIVEMIKKLLAEIAAIEPGGAQYAEHLHSQISQMLEV